MSLAALALMCAPTVDPSTVQRLIAVESAGDPLALSANLAAGPRRLRPKTLDEAVQMAQQFVDRGATVDIGLMQINSANLPKLGASVRDALDPCTNLRLGERILVENYEIARRRHGPGQRALQEALSRWNTGNRHRGFLNGYVGRVYAVGVSSRHSSGLAAAMTAGSTAYQSP